MKLKKALNTIRPPFLILTPVCVFLGISTSLIEQTPIDLISIILILIGALFAHISVNTLNEYFDFKSGLDLKTNKTPFSGGSGTLPLDPSLSKIVLIIGVSSLIITASIGIYFIFIQGLKLLPIGLSGLLVIVTYTHYLNRKPFLGLIASGTGFGIFMVVGTHLVLTEHYSWLAGVVSLVPFFLVNNLLLLNQYPDVKADTSVGRKTFPIVYGFNKSNFVYALFMTFAFSLITFLALTNRTPLISLIAVLPLALSIFSLHGAIRVSSNIGNEHRYLAANVAAAILTPMLLGLTISFG
jgi:1,4-dihydroxy-2-naphthoate octaprenyltransferase